MKSLTWAQVNEWRLAQHHLSARLERAQFIQAVTNTGGVQAQVMSAAEMALGVRVDGLTPTDVQTALWDDHTLVKTWVIRGTLHLIAAHELPLYVAARAYHDNRNWDGYFAYFGLTPAEQAAFLEAVPDVLGGEPMTRESLADALSTHTSIPHLRALILDSNWGSPLKPSAFRGDLCFGPSQGQNVTFVNPRAWLPEWQAIDPEVALAEIVRRYLCAYGPATVTDFVRWWWGGSGISPAKNIFKAVDSELETVDVEGWQAVALRSTLEPMQALGASKAVNLLPLFDAYTLGISRDLEPLLPKTHKLRVYRPQGWITAVVLVGGVIKGVWDYKTRGAQTVIAIRPFAPFTAAIKRGVEAEANRLAAFLNTAVRLEYEAL